MTDAKTPIKKAFEELGAEGSVNLSKVREKSLSYSPLGKEISIKERGIVGADVVLMRQGRKAVLRMATDDGEEVAGKMRELFPLLESVTPDEDVFLPWKGETLEVDDRKFDFDSIDAAFLLSQWEKVRDFPYPKNIAVEWFSFEVEETERTFIDSKGTVKTHKKTSSSWGIECFFSNGEQSDAWYDSSASKNLEEVDLKKLSLVVERLSAMSSPVKAPFGSGKMTIALESGVFADFLEAFCDAATAENVRQKISFFSSDAIGKSVLPEEFSIRSVARMEDSAYGRAFDSEGTTTEDVDIVSSGVLTQLFTDSKNARKMGLSLTGNPSPSNLVFMGKTDPKALSGAKFLFTNLMAFHTIDSISGKFALEGEGFVLKDGKRAGYVKNVALSGNVKDLFLGIVSSEGIPRWHGNVKTGDVVVTNLRVNA